MATLRGLKKRALRLKAHRAPVHRVPLANGSSILVDLRDEGGLQLAVWGSGRIQPLAIRAWHTLLTARRWDLVVDVGANYGEFAVPASLSGASSVLAVEPNPTVCGLLLESFRRFGGNATVCSTAVSCGSGLGALAVAGNSRVGKLVSGPGRRDEEIVVPLTTLDDLALPRLPPGGTLLVKIDVEGAEVDVIRGATDLLQRAGPAALIVETVHSDWEQITGLLPGFDTWGFDARSGRPVLLAGTTEDERAGLSVRDILATRGLDVAFLFTDSGVGRSSAMSPRRRLAHDPIPGRN